MDKVKEKIINYPGPYDPGTPVTPLKYNDDNGGGGNMDKNNYVTHKEFSDAINKIDKRFDELDKRFNQTDLNFEKVNTHFENQKSELVFAMLTITGAGVGFLSLLIALIALLK